MNNTYNLFKINFPNKDYVEKFSQVYGVRYPKQVWYNELQNSFLLDVPEDIQEMDSSLKGILGYTSECSGVHYTLLDKDNLSVEEKEWLDNRSQTRLELLRQLGLDDTRVSCDPSIHHYDVLENRGA